MCKFPAKPLSLCLSPINMAGLYVHIPFCKSKCNYCDFVSFPGREGDFSRYWQAVIKEMDARSPLPEFDTVFFGGGTPSLMPPAFAEQVLSYINIKEGGEVTSEANPNSLDREKIKAWRKAGINRLSLGAQAYQAELLALLGRPHRWEQVIEVAQYWDDGENLSLDLMYGLPGQTINQWRETLAAAVALEPGHLSCYSLIVEEGTPMHEWVEEGKIILPSDDLERDMHEAAGAYLHTYGYEQYEVSNYAREGRVCRHNMNYWQRGEYVGIGCGAHSFVDGTRHGNLEDIDEYCTAMELGKLPVSFSERIEGADALFEEVMLGLRLNAGVILSNNAKEHYAQKIERWTQSGLLWERNRHIGLTRPGMNVMNTILTDFLED